MKTTFKKGDTVKVLKAVVNAHLIGKTVKVTYADDRDVEVEGGLNHFAQGSRMLELVKPVPKFKVGDTVKIIGKGITASAQDNLGYVGKVTQVHDGNWGIYLRDKNNTARMCGDYYYTLDNSEAYEWENGLELVHKYHRPCFCPGHSIRFGGAREVMLNEIRKNQITALRDIKRRHFTFGDEADQVDAYAYMLYASRLRHLSQYHGVRFGRARRKSDTSIVLRHFLERNQPFRTNYIKVKAGSFSSMRFKIHVSYDTPVPICKVKDCTNHARSNGKKGYKSRCGGCTNRKRRALKELKKYEL